MSATPTGHIAVLDIGKTNVKLVLVDAASGETVDSRKMPNHVLQEGAYPHADLEAIWDWYCAGLREWSAQHRITQLGCTTHGATAVCIGDGAPVLPVADYEWAGYERLNADYAQVRPPYAQTLSPALGNGLNLGRQLFWQARSFADAFAQVDTILMYPQYWGWRLSGRAVSEVTSLGCHTDLWNPQQQQFSTLVDTMNWRALFPPLLAAGEALGPVLPELAQALGLPPECLVMNGVHDSNASLVPYLQQAQAPFTVISSGTWIIMAAVGAPLAGLQEADDMLANVNVRAEPVPSIRFMGGREWELLAEAPEADFADLQAVLAAQVYHLPAFSAQGGPFRERQGRTVGPFERLNPRQKTALASLYCALVTDACLTRVQSQGPIYLEGSFARNAVFCGCLQALRPEQTLWVSVDGTGTTAGVVELIRGGGADLGLVEVADRDADLDERIRGYRGAWYELENL
ncbi:MAG: FGGY family carbohydrate kinase [Thiolinea sp.]